jgi:hypothetical protein
LDGNNGENKRLHLQMIQGVVNRLAQNSFLIKGWSVLLVAALFALAANNDKPPFAWVALFPALTFWILDGYFLWQERMFRALYDAVCGKPEEKIDYSMNTSPFREKVVGWSSAAFNIWPPRNTLFIFHGTIVVAILAVAAILISLQKNGE